MISHFTKTHTIYQEVKASSRRLIDIVMKKDGVITTIETKLLLNLKVIEQAYINKDFSNCSYVAVPEKSWNSSKTSMMRTLLSSLNIGLITVDDFQHVKIVISPTPILPKKKLMLYDEQKSYSSAGSSGCPIFTPFKKTVENIKEYITKNGSSNVYTIMTSIEHHYKTNQSAISSIRRYARKGILKGIKIIEENDTLHIEDPK